MTKYDVVYWWQGGTERGLWREASLDGREAADVVASIRRMGYYAVPGRQSIGAPEGNPLQRLDVKDLLQTQAYARKGTVTP